MILDLSVLLRLSWLISQHHLLKYNNDVRDRLREWSNQIYKAELCSALGRRFDSRSRVILSTGYFQPSKRNYNAPRKSELVERKRLTLITELTMTLIN